MQLKCVNIFVADQARALACYTEVLGFETMADIPIGEYRWLTVTSPDGIAGVELVLEPMALPPASKWGVGADGGAAPAVFSNGHSTTRRQVGRTSGTFHDV